MMKQLNQVLKQRYSHGMPKTVKADCTVDLKCVYVYERSETDTLHSLIPSKFFPPFPEELWLSGKWGHLLDGRVFLLAGQQRAVRDCV